MHDLLISTRIWNYEPGRLDEAFTPRGEELPASTLLLDATRHVQEEGENIHFGIVASGEKLIDSATFVKSLKAQKPQLVGGEMEGSGMKRRFAVADRVVPRFLSHTAALLA